MTPMAASESDQLKASQTASRALEKTAARRKRAQISNGVMAVGNRVTISETIMALKWQFNNQ